MNMIATIWLFSLLSTTMLREIECMYESPIVEYEINDPFTSVEEVKDIQHQIENWKLNSHLQDTVQMEKRTKPSLSITSPLDTLRQRLMLKIARRQMRENSKQVTDSSYLGGAEPSYIEKCRKTCEPFGCYGFPSTGQGSI